MEQNTLQYLLIGHDLRHAVEEMLYHLLPAFLMEQAPTHDALQSGNQLCSVAEGDTGAVTVTTTCVLAGTTTTHTETAQLGEVDDLERKRRTTELVKMGIFHTVTAHTHTVPTWGALTGVRPAKLARLLMERGKSRGEAAQYFRERFHVSPERTALSFRAAAHAQQIRDQLQNESVSLYVGIPFCPSRCSYCSFVSQSIEKSAHLIDPYVQALCDEIADTATMLQAQGRKLSSIYMGGGTPTTLSAAQLDRVLGQIATSMHVSDLCEYTVEAGRPDTITREKLQVMHDYGVGRISINPQTMNDTVLQNIGRKHTAQDVLDCLHLARTIGFDAINMDLIAGLQGETAQSFSHTLDILLREQPENITVHALAIKRGADLTDRAQNAAQHARVAQMLDETAHRLPAHGYGPYYLYRQKFSAGGFENVGWCQQGKESYYNIAMMEELEHIVSCGAGGVSKTVDLTTGKIERYNAPKYPVDYLVARERIDAGKRRLFGV